MMICPNCGSENRDDVSSCINCGQRFAPKTNPAQSDNTDTSANAQSRQGEPYPQDTPYSQADSYSQDNNSSHGTYGHYNYQSSGCGSNNGGPNDANYNPNGSPNANPNGGYNPNDVGYNPNGGYGSYNDNYNPNNGGYGPNDANYNPNGGSCGPDNYYYGPNNYGPENMNGGYNQNPYQGPGGREPFNGMAIASLVIGIISAIPCCLFPYIGIPLNIVGLVLGIISRRKPFGRGMSIAGTVLNIIFLVLATIWLIVVLYIYFNVSAQSAFDVYQNYMY